MTGSDVGIGTGPAYRILRQRQALGPGQQLIRRLQLGLQRCHPGQGRRQVHVLHTRDLVRQCGLDLVQPGPAGGEAGLRDAKCPGLPGCRADRGRQAAVRVRHRRLQAWAVRRRGQGRQRPHDVAHVGPGGRRGGDGQGVRVGQHADRHALAVPGLHRGDGGADGRGKRGDRRVCQQGGDQRRGLGVGHRRVGRVLPGEDVGVAHLAVQQARHALQGHAGLRGNAVGDARGQAVQGRQLGVEVGGHLADGRQGRLGNAQPGGGAVDVADPGLLPGDLRAQVQGHARPGAQPGIGLGHLARRGLLRGDRQLAADRRAILGQRLQQPVAGDGVGHPT